MRADELWVESYQGEVMGEAFFGVLARRQDDSERKRELETLVTLERSTKELAEPVLARRGLSPVDSAGSVAKGEALAEAVKDLSWDQFVQSIEGSTAQFLAQYTELAGLVDGEEHDVAVAYVAHERALHAWARRRLGLEEGDPLERILALAHVQRAVAGLPV